MNIMKHNAKIGFWASGMAICCLVFLFITNPQNLSPIFLILPFILLFLCLLLAGIYTTVSLTRPGHTTITRKKILLIAFCAAYPILLLLLQSIGQLSPRDVVTLTLLLLISGFYVSKTNLGT
jgi:ABC-type transport system involved in multi-copper enzyme maturation permease subunit